MREKKFTPGPWAVENDDGMNPGITAVDGKAVVWITDKVEEGIESVHDAHLMAASPEMLVLLEVASCPNCDGSGGRYDSFGNAEQCQWCYEREQVLAKACGETP